MRSRRRLRGSFLVVVWAILTACIPAPIEDQGYELVFVDYFDGDAPGGIWAIAPYSASLPATVSDGVLTLAATADNGYRSAYLASTGPRFDTEPSYPLAQAWEEGYFEARIRFTDNPWAWPAFWLFSMAKSEAWPGEDCTRLNSEWDIMENGIGNEDGTRPPSESYYGVIHRNTTDNTPDGYCGLPDESRSVQRSYSDINLSEWHTWAGRWTDNELCSYLDDVEIGCMATYDTTAQPMHLTFSLSFQGICGGCPPRPSELELQVDWVRVWQQTGA